MKPLNNRTIELILKNMKPQKVVSSLSSFLVSPRFASLLGVALATMQLIQAIEMMREAPKSQKRIGFRD